MSRVRHRHACSSYWTKRSQPAVDHHAAETGNHRVLVASLTGNNVRRVVTAIGVPSSHAPRARLLQIKQTSYLGANCRGTFDRT
eukprot:m.207196 g.207196  ORF g.207196 m.207196 type:complete len:84 (+) comp18515_c1_seq2:288-539(+)